MLKRLYFLWDLIYGLIRVVRFNLHRVSARWAQRPTCIILLISDEAKASGCLMSSQVLAGRAQEQGWDRAEAMLGVLAGRAWGLKYPMSLRSHKGCCLIQHLNIFSPQKNSLSMHNVRWSENSWKWILSHSLTSLLSRPDASVILLIRASGYRVKFSTMINADVATHTSLIICGSSGSLSPWPFLATSESSMMEPAEDHGGNQNRCGGVGARLWISIGLALSVRLSNLEAGKIGM